MADVERPLRKLYGQRDDYQTWRDHFLTIVARNYARRSADLRRLDVQRLTQPDWFQQSNMVGYVCYADRFAGTSARCRRKNPLSQRIRSNLSAPDAAVKTPPRSQRWRLCRHGLPAGELTDLGHNGRSRQSGRRAAGQRNYPLHRSRLQPYGQGTPVGAAGHEPAMPSIRTIT